MTPEYELALNAVREATRKFKTIRDSYRAGKATDSEYLAARKVYEEADRVYELAYAKEQRKGMLHHPDNDHWPNGGHP